jgi:small subunit ribosomal protein S13
MPRIVGIDIPKEKRIEISLRYIYGVGPAKSVQVCAQAGVNPDTRAKDLTEEEIAKIASAIQSICRVEGDLRREVAQDIKRLMSIGCYRGIRHRRGLPVHGQHTSTNARTRKGPRKTVGVKRKASLKKQGAIA